MQEHFCTYFDHRYAPKGLAMWRSLKRHQPDATLHVLCLTDACFEILRACHLQDVGLYRLADVEHANPTLVRARGDRSLIEYYFSLTPFLPLHVLGAHPEVRRLTYVDADLLFFANPQPVFDEIGEGSVGVIEHRFPPELADLEKYGRFNVGWLTFKRDAAATSCLESWRDQCIDWCHDRLEDGRFAEQKYLDAWPDVVPSLTVVRHKGANVAAWNLAHARLSFNGRDLTIDGEPLLFFHAHGFQLSSPGRPRRSNLAPYGVLETATIEEAILKPYEAAVSAAAADLAGPLSLALLADQSRDSHAILEHLTAHTSHLETHIAAIESDRAARLGAIRDLERNLSESESDRAARLDAIRDLEVRLAASDADRAAQLDVIAGLRRELETRTSEADDVRGRLDDATRRLLALQSQMESLERSRIWRLTRPIRAIADLFRRPS